MSFRVKQEQGNFAPIYAGEQVKNIVLNCGIDIVREEENWIDIFCPYHHNVRTSSAGLNKEHGTFNCFSCGITATLEEFVMYATNKTYFEAIRFIEKEKESQDIVSLLASKINSEPDYPEFDSILIKKYNESALTNLRAVQYLKGRGITKQSAENFLLGYIEEEDMICIPIHMPNGRCVGLVQRSIEGKIFKNTPGLPKSKTLFNIHSAKKYDNIFVVESSFDAIRIEQSNGHAVATLGANISSGQLEILGKYFNRIFVVGDNDKAGKEMEKKVIDKLPTITRSAILPPGYKDVSEMEQEKLTEYISNIDNHILVGI
jgi:DNA primase